MNFGQEDLEDFSDSNCACGLCDILFFKLSRSQFGFTMLLSMHNILRLFLKPYLNIFYVAPFSLASRCC